MRGRYWLLPLLLLLCFSARASHIVGGNLGYTYLGPGVNNTFRYKVTLITYTDCSPSSEIPVPEPSLNVGVYFHNRLNPDAPKTLKQALTLPLIYSAIITPPLPPGCSVGLGTCIYKGVYETEVVLEYSLDGYHLYYERCCRNTALVNLQNPSQTSTGFHAFIPSSDLLNSSPVFLDDPVPLICVNDTLYLQNAAQDPDGDQLIYSFTVPYAGFADVFNPAPLPQPVLSWPITPVTYQGGFSATQPFGPGSYNSIHALNGIAVFKTDRIGNFAVAVQVSEYRNGQLISVTRRDMQLISLVCPQNQPPVGPQTTFGSNLQITEGDTACFDFTYYEPDGDSIFLEVEGEPFLSVSPATVFQEYTGPSSLRGRICWVPPCGSARTQPYVIYYKAKDNGCIPRERINQIRITVLPDTARMHILGDTLVCGLQSVVYGTDKPNGIFNWTVTGGTAAPPSAGPSIRVNWNLAQGQQGTLRVIRDGVCVDDTTSLTVRIAPPEFAGRLADLWLCPGSLGTLLAEPGGSAYQWTPTAWLSNPNIHNPITNTPDSLMYAVQYRDSLGCEKFDSAWVIVNGKVPVDAGMDRVLCRGIGISLGGSPTAPPGATFSWVPAVEFADPTVANPFLPAPQGGWYSVTASVDTCRGTDSVFVTVHPLPMADAGRDTAYCYGIPFQLHGSNNNTSLTVWDGRGLTLSDPADARTLAQGDPGVYFPVLTATSPHGCKVSDSVRIEIWALPDIRITGDSSVCRGDTALVSGTGGQHYQWYFDGYLSAPTDNPVRVYSDTSAFVYLTGRDSNGCIANDTAYIRVFRGFLQTPGDTVLCLGEHVTLHFDSDNPDQILWSPPHGLNQTTGSPVIAKPDHDIVYHVYTNNDQGCSDSAEVRLYVMPLPVLSATYETVLFCDYVEVTASGAGADSLYWLKQNHPEASGSPVTIHLDPKNPENIQLVGVSTFGCADTLDMPVQFDNVEKLLPPLPNIITPNGDQVNDAWDPPLPQSLAGCTRLTIYNRWGNEVFDFRGYPIRWEGKSPTGMALTDGVYFYVLEMGGLFRKGSVTISR